MPHLPRPVPTRSLITSATLADLMSESRMCVSMPWSRVLIRRVDRSGGSGIWKIEWIPSSRESLASSSVGPLCFSGCLSDSKCGEPSPLVLTSITERKEAYSRDSRVRFRSVAANNAVPLTGFEIRMMLSASVSRPTTIRMTGSTFARLDWISWSELETVPIA